MTECDRCGIEWDTLETIALRDEHELCSGCVTDMDASIDEYRWHDRYTEEQHERAVSALSEMDEVQCVIDSYERGQVIVHTPYVASEVVLDYLQHFGFRVMSFGPIWYNEHDWPCLEEHESTFQIVLQYDHYCKKPCPLDTVFDTWRADALDENDKQF